MKVHEGDVLVGRLELAFTARGFKHPREVSIHIQQLTFGA
jgi:hypothetical protein